METTLLALILLVLVNALVPGGFRGLVLGTLAALVICAAFVTIVGAIAYVASQSSHPWYAVAAILLGIMYLCAAAQTYRERSAARKGQRNGAGDGDANSERRGQ